MRDTRIFLNQLQNSKKSFLDHFKKNKKLRKILFDQYLLTELKPNKDLYYEEFNNKKAKNEKEDPNRTNSLIGCYTKEEEKEINILFTEYIKSINEKSLPKKYYAHNIEDTSIFINLKLISENIERFKKRILLPSDFDPAKYSESITSKLFFLLEETGINELTTITLNDFLIDNKNFMITSELIVGNEVDFQLRHKKTSKVIWEYYYELKGYADMEVKKYLNKMNKNENLESPKKRKFHEVTKIPAKISAIFKFIDFLDANKQEYIKYLPLVESLQELGVRRRNINKNENYKSKIEYDAVQKELSEKSIQLQEKVNNPIKAKLKKLQIWNGDDGCLSIYNLNIEAVSELKRDFDENSIAKIQEYKSKYLGFRNDTNTNFISLGFMLDELDDVLKQLFDFFKDATETVEVNSLNDVAKEKTEFVKLKISGLSINIEESDRFKNMPVIKQHYLPLIDGLKTKINNNEIPTNEIKSYWKTLRTQIESDLYDPGKFYNDETIEFCKKRIFPLIDIEIKKAKQIISSQETTKPDQFKEIELSKKKFQKNNQFSALEWATIFYYADETKLLPENKFIKNRMEQFMNSYSISTTFNSFKSKYHTAKNRINKSNDYPISKLELIIPFLKEHYNQTVTKVEHDINYLESECTDYQ